MALPRGALCFSFRPSVVRVPSFSKDALLHTVLAERSSPFISEKLNQAYF